MKLEEVLKQNYMGFILRLRDDEKKYDHFEWFATGRFEEVFNTVKHLAVYYAMLKFYENWKCDIDFLLESGKVNAAELKVISHFNTKNSNAILNSEESEFVALRDYIRRAFGVRLWQLHKNMDSNYNSMRDAITVANREKELKKKRWQARMAIETIEDGKHDVLYGGTERQIREAYYEYYYDLNDNS